MKLILVLTFWLPVLALIVFNYRKHLFQWDWPKRWAAWWSDWLLGFRHYWIGFIRYEDWTRFGDANDWEAYSNGHNWGLTSVLVVLGLVSLALVFSIEWAL